MLNANRLHRINIKRLLLSFSLVVASLSATGCGNSAAQSEANTFVGKRNPVNETIPQASAPICSVDRFQQPKDPISKKVDVLFVMDNSNSMNRHWQLMAKGIGKLIHAFPPGQDIRFSVVLGTITKFPGVLFSDPSVPKVLDGKKMSEQQIINALTKTFSYAMRYENIDWKGAGEALFYSLYYATTANALAIQKQGFFRPDAALSVILMSDDAEESYPYPEKQVWDLPPKCNWGHHETMRKTFYVPNKINSDTTFAALKRLKGDLPLLTSAFVNITKQDILVDNSPNARCIFDSPGFGYFDLVKKTNGLLYSIHQDRERGLELSGKILAGRVNLIHDFKLSKPSDKVDPSTIEAKVDTRSTPHSYEPSLNLVHIEEAGSPGSLVEISHCEPQPLPIWSISNFSGEAGQFQASLRWETSSYPTTGKIIYGTSPDALGLSAEDPVSSLSHTVGVTGLVPDSTYFFQAIGKDEFGQERKSEILSLHTRPDWAIANFMGQASRTSASLSWRTENYPTQGVIAWGIAPDQLSRTQPAPIGVSHQVIVSGLDPGTIYYFQSSARDEFGLIKSSPIISLRTSNDWEIVGLAGKASRNSAAFSWQTPDETTAAQLRFGLAPNQLTNFINDAVQGNSHSVNLSGLAPGTTYYFQASAKSLVDGREKLSPVLSLTTLKDWNIENLGSLATESSVSISFNTSDYPTNGIVLWGKSENQLVNQLNAGNLSTEHSAGVSGLDPNTTYYFQAVAQDDLGVERRSPVLPVRTKPAPLPVWQITNLDGSSTVSSVTLGWLTANYPTKAEIRYGANPSALNQVIVENSPAKEHQITVNNLNPDSLYYFQVLASDDKGQTQQSPILGLRTQALPLPEWEISPISGESTQTTIKVRFSTDAYATTSLIRWGLNASALDQQSARETEPLTNHEFEIRGLSNDTTYFVQAEATDDRGQSKYSRIFSFRTQGLPLPTWEISDIESIPTQNSATIKWKTNGYETKGLVRWGVNASNLENQTLAETTPGLTHSFLIGSLQPESLYYFQVISTDDRGQTKSSQISSFRTPALPLPSWSISDFRANPARNSVDLIFSTIDYPTIAYIRWGTSPGTLNQQTNMENMAQTIHSFNVGSLAPNTTYYFQAVASDDRGQTKTSGIIAAQPLPEAPPSWEITGLLAAPSVHSVTLNWNTTAYATTGRVRWGYSPNELVNISPPESGKWNSHSVTVSELQAGTTFYFQAESFDDYGQTKKSSVISVKTSVIPPSWVISGFDGTTTSNSASLIWQTGVPTKSLLRVGLSATDLNFKTIELPSFTAAHVISVDALVANTSYYFQVIATDADGGVVTSNIISKKTKAKVEKE